MTQDQQLTMNWLGMPPTRPEIRRMKYWFNRLKTEMYSDPQDPGDAKARFALLITRMVEMFPQYEKLKNGEAYQETILYKGIWRHFQRMLAKWQKDSPKKLRSSPRNLS